MTHDMTLSSQTYFDFHHFKINEVPKIANCSNNSKDTEGTHSLVVTGRFCPHPWLSLQQKQSIQNE